MCYRLLHESKYIWRENWVRTQLLIIDEIPIYAWETNKITVYDNTII